LKRAKESVAPNYIIFAIKLSAKNTTNQSIGKRGEDKAVSYLTKAGYKIIARNFRVQLGEVDIIAQENNQIVFVEVKARSCSIFGFPEEAINKRKLIKIKQVGEIWLNRHPKYPQSPRIDLIAILGQEINHYQNIGNF